MNAPTPIKNLLPASGVQQGTDIVHESAHLHVTGSATYIDDIREPEGLVHVYPGFAKDGALGKIKSLEQQDARTFSHYEAVARAIKRA